MQLRCQAIPVLVAGEVILFCRCEWNPQVDWRSADAGGVQPLSTIFTPQSPALNHGLPSQVQCLQWIRIEVSGKFA
jgi:hypothetical protein